MSDLYPYSRLNIFCLWLNAAKSQFEILSFVKILFFEFLFHHFRSSFVTIWEFEFCHNLRFWVLLQFEFLNCVTICVLSCVTIWVFEFCHNYIFFRFVTFLVFGFCHSLVTVGVLSQFKSWVFSQIKFVNFVTILVCKFCHNLSCWFCIN